MQAMASPEALLQEIVLEYTYPRIDSNVSIHQNHLLKVCLRSSGPELTMQSPFCVHPGTGRVCVPLALEDVEAFKPEDVPTVGQLLRELERARQMAAPGTFKDQEGNWEHTSLRPYVEFFERYCNGIIKDARDKKKGASSVMECAS